MNPQVSIIMGSTSDLPVMEKAAALLDEFGIPFEMNALSAHRTPREVEAFATGAQARGIRVIIAAAGMAAHLPGVIGDVTCFVQRHVEVHTDDCLLTGKVEFVNRLHSSMNVE